MRFEEALVAMRKGHSVRRPREDQRSYWLHYRKQVGAIFSEDGSIARLGNADVLSEAWEISDKVGGTFENAMASMRANKCSICRISSPTQRLRLSADQGKLEGIDEKGQPLQYEYPFQQELLAEDWIACD